MEIDKGVEFSQSIQTAEAYQCKIKRLPIVGFGVSLIKPTQRQIKIAEQQDARLMARLGIK